MYSAMSRNVPNMTSLDMLLLTEVQEQAADMAQMAVDGGIYVEDYSHLEEEAREIAHIDLIDEELLAKDREHGLVHLYISPEENPKEALAFLRERCAGEGIDCEFSVESCAEEDWINNWKQYFHPIPVGEKLLIRPTWEEAYDPQGRTVLHLEPGLAFGTGTHETTRLCLELLEKYLKPGMSLLDVGCGSGILSVAGLLLGAEKAVGVDIDAQSVKTARENAELNNQDDKTEYIVGDLADKVSGRFNVVCANIVADVVIRLLENVRDYMAENAVLLVSGIIDAREQDVLRAAERHGLTVKEKQYKDNWCAFALI